MDQNKPVNDKPADKRSVVSEDKTIKKAHKKTYKRF